MRLAITLCTLSLALPILSADESAPSAVSVRELVDQWAQLRQETVQLEEDWEWKRGIIENNTHALQERQETIRKEVALIEATSSSELRQLDELQDKATDAQTSLNEMSEALETVSAQLLELRPQLPPRLSRALELPFLSLGDDALPPGERMQLVITVFNRCAEFNKSVQLSQEPVVVDSGEEIMLEVLYWGLAQAYALDRQAGTAYRGFPENGTWVWVSEPGIAGKVAQAIDIFNEDQDPSFVTLPVHLSD